MTKTSALPRGNSADDALNESAAARRIGIDVATLRRLRFHKVGPAFIRSEGVFFYPLRALDQWCHGLKRDHAALCAAPHAESANFDGDFLS